jgi:hypothetical protein
MSPENKSELIYVTGLAGTFKGGRISGWIERNRQSLGEGEVSSVELELLDKLCPSFATETKGLTPEQKAQAARDALVLADQSPLSATNYEPTFPDSMTLVRKSRP